MCTRQVYVFVRQLAVREQIRRQRSTHPETFQRLHGCQQLLGAGAQQHVSQGGRRPHVAVRRHEGQTFLIHPGTTSSHLHGHALSCHDRQLHVLQNRRRTDGQLGSDIDRPDDADSTADQQQPLQQPDRGRSV